MYNYSSSISWIFIVSFLYGPDAENLLHDHTYDESRAVWKQWRMKLPLLTTRGSSAWIPVRWGPFICGHSSVSCSTLLTYDVSLSANLGGAFSLMVQHRRRCFTQITCEKIKGMRCRFQDEKSLRTPHLLVRREPSPSPYASNAAAEWPNFRKGIFKKKRWREWSLSPRLPVVMRGLEAGFSDEDEQCSVFCDLETSTVR